MSSKIKLENFPTEKEFKHFLAKTNLFIYGVSDVLKKLSAINASVHINVETLDGKIVEMNKNNIGNLPIHSINYRVDQGFTDINRNFTYTICSNLTERLYLDNHKKGDTYTLDKLGLHYSKKDSVEEVVSFINKNTMLYRKKTINLK